MSFVETKDSGDRRSRIDRRQFSYSFHIPERRFGMDRRSGVDRRGERYNNRGDKERRQTLQLFDNPISQGFKLLIT